MAEADSLTKYSWWGTGRNEPPENLKTKSQLSEMGLSPSKPVGVIETHKYDCLLYDCNDRSSSKPKRQLSDKQREALARNREKAKRNRAFQEWLDCEGGIELDRCHAVRWSKRVLANPTEHVILDTETTGLGDAEVIEIAIIDLQKTALLDTLIKPTITIPEEVIGIHGITDHDVADAPSFPEVAPKIVAALKDRKILIYNSAFDIRVLNYTRKLHNLQPFKLTGRCDCIMEWYSQWVGDWSDYWENYRWQPLGGGHRALGDCLAALDKIQMMAEDSEILLKPSWAEPKNGWDAWLKKHYPEAE
jgi:DNA polymerase III subunit epsilon